VVEDGCLTSGGLARIDEGPRTEITDDVLTTEQSLAPTDVSSKAATHGRGARALAAPSFVLVLGTIAARAYEIHDLRQRLSVTTAADDAQAGVCDVANRINTSANGCS
jgi:hypothetical protein